MISVFPVRFFVLSNREKIQVITFGLLDGDSSSSAVFPELTTLLLQFCVSSHNNTRKTTRSRQQSKRALVFAPVLLHPSLSLRRFFAIHTRSPTDCASREEERERKEKGFLLFSAFWREGSQGTAQQHSRGKREREGWRERGTSSRQRC